MRALRRRARSTVERVQALEPSRKTSPDVGRSSRPRMWSSVVLPAPEGPIKARRSPARSSRSTPCRISSVESPTWKRLKILCAARTGSPAWAFASVIAKGLDGIHPGRPPRGEGGEHERADERAEHDQRDGGRRDDGGDLVEQVDVPVEDHHVEGVAEPTLERVDLDGGVHADER